MRVDVRQFRAGAQSLAALPVLTARPVDEEYAEPVGPCGGGQ